MEWLWDYRAQSGALYEHFVLGWRVVLQLGLHVGSTPLKLSYSLSEKRKWIGHGNRRHRCEGCESALAQGWLGVGHVGESSRKGSGKRAPWMSSAGLNTMTFLGLLKSSFEALVRRWIPLEKDNEDCLAFVLIPNEPPWSVMGRSGPNNFIVCTIQWSDSMEDIVGLPVSVP